MLYSQPSVSILLFLSALVGGPGLVRALPDFSCVCETANRNGCSRSYSCRLNSTIDFYHNEVPDWVTDVEETLFINTIDDAVSGLLSPPFFSLGRMTWEASMACDDEDGQLRWYPTLSSCRATTTTTNITTGDRQTRRRLHGWANLGFHPLGNQPGTWLTQILGEIEDPDGEEDSHLVSARCADTGLYTSIDYINDTQPYDPRFSPMGDWGMLYLYSKDRVYPVGPAGVPSYKTDGDLIKNGVDLNCTGYDTTGRVCEQPSCSEAANVSHYACAVGQTGNVGAGNCSRTYKEQKSSGAKERELLMQLGWVSALSLALAFGL